MLARNTQTALTSTPAPASDATRLRVLAGTPHSRRGSVLVLVVGVLALLAIIIVVYTSVGQADVRGGRTLVNQARLDDQSHAMRDYLRVVIGNDASATRIQPVSLPSGEVVNLSVREGVDYPYTDPNSRSQLAGIANPAVAAAARFDPSGNITTQWTGTDLDPRVGSDAYLASTEPTWINRGFGTLPAIPTPFALMGHHRDWAHMSIVSPSGLPVNLAALRGNWTAQSGFPTTPYSTTGPLMMSDWLYTWETASTAGYMVAPTARRTPNTPAGIDAYNTPAHWSNDCTSTFRPTTWNPGSLVMGDVKFMGNMLADADGDGFYDARWQELVDVSDPARPVNLLPGGTGGGVRWFIAPRIIDLSGLVNINTATSFAVPPDAENPAGLTPSDVDLERLLTTADARQYFGINPSVTHVGGGIYRSPTEVTDAGRWAFAGIIEGRATGLVEVVDSTYTDPAGPVLISPPWLADMGVQRNGGPAIGSVTRKLLYTLGGKDTEDGQLRNPPGTNAGYYLKQPSGYGLGDELDLRAFGSVNDPRSRSRIEASAATTATGNLFAAMNPFRPDRDLITDRDAGLSLTAANTVTVGGEIVPRAFAQYHSGIRQQITTISGARPLAFSLPQLPLTPGQSAARPILDSELRVDINTLLQSAISVAPQATNNTQRVYPLSAANAIFTNYALALSPFLGSVGNGAGSQSLWNQADLGGNNLRALTLSFGGVTYDTATSGTNVGETAATQLFKGRASEIAVRSAAYLALNLMAARDDTRINPGTSAFPDNRPLAATVLLNDDFRDEVATLNYPGPGTIKRFPYWKAGAGRLAPNVTTSLNPAGTTTADIKGYTFDLNGTLPNTINRLAGASTQPPMTSGYAVNIFAAQPQPFITSAVSFDMYVDAPGDRGGDSIATGPADVKGEWYVRTPAGPSNTPPAVVESLGITIRGDVSLVNTDFLMEAIAFQVTNPFDVPLTLTDGSGTFSYYFEFGGRFYDARAHDDNGDVISGPVSIPARQSMCFYALSQTPNELMIRWRDMDNSITSITGLGVGETPVSAWIRRQLRATTGGAAAVYTVPIDPANPNTPLNPGSLRTVLASSATSDDNKVVKLWRVVVDRTGGETVATNSRANDYLVDRLHEPTFGDPSRRSALYRRLNSGFNRFSDILAGPEPSDTPYSANNPQLDNVGFAITMFGAVRRRTDPIGGPLPGQAGESTTGVLPAWCVETKRGASFRSDTTSLNVTDNNTGFVDETSTAGIDSGDFASHPWGAPSFRGMLSNAIARSYTTASRHPAVRKGIGAAGSGGTGDDPADVLRNDLDGADWALTGKPMQLPVYPRRSITPVNPVDIALPPLRPADLLMPWAIGPYQYAELDPVAPGSASYHDVEEVRNITLSEAMAMGLNYTRGLDNKSYEFQIGQALDRCHLPLNRHVPFNDANSNAQWNYNSGNADPFISNGVPFALNVLDRFRTTRYGSIDSVMPGLVNLNTMSLNVARTLPLLSPASANVYGNDTAGFKGSWMNNSLASPFALRIKNETGAQNTSASLWANDEPWDIAATLIAYRDQQAVVMRGEQGDEDGTSRRYVDFSRGTATAVGNDGNLFNASTTVRPGRPFMTNIPNVRQEMGFQTTGEVLLATVQDNTQRFTTQTLSADELKQMGIDRMETKLNADGTQTTLTNFETPVRPIQEVVARGLTTGNEVQRNQSLGLTGFPAVRRETTGATEHFVQGGKSSDYDRKLAIANALLNTVSTTSDIYCAYFLVNGYTEADTQGLETYTGTGSPTEDRFTRPMTPSIQRRYMMVLDRSACVRAGDKPKVLMFEELPVK